MANIKIAQLTTATTINDTDVVLIEDATTTKKMTVANLKALTGINAKAPSANPLFTGNIGFNGWLQATKQANDSGGAMIMGTIFPIQMGLLFVSEINTSKFMLATFYKLTGVAPVVSILQSNGLTLGSSNTLGTQIINGATVSGNVRMKALIYDLSV